VKKSVDKTTDKIHPVQSFLHKIKDIIFHGINSVVTTISSSVHIPEVAVGPIVSSLITATVTLILGLFTLSNIFSEQILFRPLQIQDSTAKFDLMNEQYQQTILNTYFQDNAQLLLNNNLLKNPQYPAIFRATTQANLAEIAPKRKRYIILFLIDTELIKISYKHAPFPLLENADLSNIDLHNINLNQVNFFGANLTQGNLQNTNLREANLKKTILKKANFKNADLRKANLTQTQIIDTDFHNACYDLQTQFNPNFDPVKAGMKKVLNPLEPC
jgi:uncharacterized protein YjbI with pentapeptide repeats